jgi:hypothetical protein
LSVNSSKFKTPLDDPIIEIKHRLDESISSILTCKKWNKKDCKKKIILYFNRFSDYLRLFKGVSGEHIEDKYNYIKTIERIQDYLKTNNILKNFTDFTDFSKFINDQYMKREYLTTEIERELNEYNKVNNEWTEDDVVSMKAKIDPQILKDLIENNPEFKDEKLLDNYIRQIMGIPSPPPHGGNNKKYPFVRSKRFQHPARSTYFSRKNTKKKTKYHRRKTVRRLR